MQGSLRGIILRHRERLVPHATQQRREGGRTDHPAACYTTTTGRKGGFELDVLFCDTSATAYQFGTCLFETRGGRAMHRRDI